MTPLAWVLGLVMPACGAEGAQGLPVPPVMDMAAIVRPASPNTALAGPTGFTPTPDVVTPIHRLPAAKLYAVLRATAEAEPRVFLAAAYDDRLQVHYVARTAVLNFPDLVTAQVRADGPDASTLVLYSRSVYGHSDFGANRARVDTWLARIGHSLAPTTGAPTTGAPTTGAPTTGAPTTGAFTTGR